MRRALQDLIIAASAREKFSALFVTHDLAEAVRLAHRIVVLSGQQEGIVAERTLDGAPSQRDDRSVFETVQAWMQDPSFADLFDGDRQ
ncbi:hypothetical protein ASE61_08985 [Bosea sp. Root670]|uniref:hypothetical protein n=1 Tax=Bosea sp. Root670 TaxID=1736583 RepID=UPI000712C906|nr:hypothetical protein [Bosea sp. Root670]KRE03760.1 hypothetical protein ASE61_08985 [Bosea sp. Root670]